MKFITLAIDKKTAEMITGLMNMIDPQKFTDMMARLDVTKEGLAFFAEFAKASHEQGWCKDPDCLLKQEKK